MLKSVAVNASILLHNKTQINLKIDEFYINDILVNSTTFGNLNPVLIKEMLNSIVELAIPVIDGVLAKHAFNIPTKIFGDLFVLSDLTLKYFNDFIELGATPKFLPPNKTESLPPYIEPLGD